MLQRTVWNSHSFITIGRPIANQAPWYWGRGERTDDARVSWASMQIDGAAATPITKWDGDPKSQAWVGQGVTSLPYIPVRCAIAVVLVAPLATVLWFCFPLGLLAVERISGSIPMRFASGSASTSTGSRFGRSEPPAAGRTAQNRPVGERPGFLLRRNSRCSRRRRRIRD